MFGVHGGLSALGWGCRVTLFGVHLWGAGGAWGGLSTLGCRVSLSGAHLWGPQQGLRALTPSVPSLRMAEGSSGDAGAGGSLRPGLPGARGLLGRRPAPPLSPGRLPSIRSRDLTLGGVKKASARFPKISFFYYYYF